MTPSTQRAEERHARDLHRRLAEALADLAGATAEVDGAGVHWHCSASRGGRDCQVACFDDDGAQYLAAFHDGDATAATGRTRGADDVAAAVAGWLRGEEMPALYERFAFIDWEPRALRRLEAEALARCPELEGGTSRELRQIIDDVHEMWFRAGDRSCRVSIYGGNDSPDAAFHWDETELFVVRAADAGRLGPLLSRWLCDRAMPSALERDFPWLALSPVARHYEEGSGVEGEFLASWDAIARFYEREGRPISRCALAFIARLRESGFDRTLRAGQSLFALLVSRSRRHGLRADQSWIAFEFGSWDGRAGDGTIRATAYLDGGQESLTIAGPDLPPELMALLERLEAKPID